MPDEVKSIGEIAFFGCVNLEEFDFPANLEVIGCAAFTNCQKLRKITIHKNINNYIELFKKNELFYVYPIKK